MTLMIKDPGARIDVSVDWGAHYLDGQTIVTSGWTVEPNGDDAITIVASSYALSVTAATVSGGSEGASYRLSNRVALSDGQIDERSFHIRVEQQ